MEPASSANEVAPLERPPINEAPPQLSPHHHWLHPVPSALWFGLQTGATAAACFELARLFGLSQGYWAGMTAIVVLQSDITATNKSATDRLYGTAIGAAFGWLAGTVGVESHALTFGAAVALAVLVCHILKLESAGRISGLTAAIVLLTHGTMPLWHIAMVRFLEVSLGIIVAVSVSWLAARLERAFPNLVRTEATSGSSPAKAS